MRRMTLRDVGRPRLGWLLAALCAAGAAVAACNSTGSAASPEGPTDAGSFDASMDGESASDGGSDGGGESSTPDGARDATGDADLDAGATDGCVLGPNGEAVDLSCAGLYSDWATKTIAPGLVQYTPGLQLWSDGAQKTRWVQLPAGQKIDTSNMDEWTFPVGTKFWKEFVLPTSGSATPVRIETRLIWKQGVGNWLMTTYRWSADGQTSATELTKGEMDANGEGYEVPSVFECNDCHQGRLDNVMGFEAVGLSAPGTSGVTMADLVQQGLVTNAPDSGLAVPGNAVESAALGWLHVNCGIACHNSGGGLAATSGFLARLGVATLGSVQSTDTYTTAWNHTANQFSIPDAGTTYLIHACDVAESAVYYRPSVRDGVNGVLPSSQMPPIDTHKVDVPGVAEIAAWINQGCATDAGAD
jgi:hypothetical protein